MEGSDKPIILGELPPGPHKVRFELMDANHRKLDEGTVSFVVPENAAAEKHADGRKLTPSEIPAGRSLRIRRTL
jgi:hypothetical protein